jgi:integrase
VGYAAGPIKSKRRHQTWYVRVQIPKHLWAAARGRRAFLKSLKTHDLNEANSLKHGWIAEFKRQIKALAQRRHDPMREIRERALSWRDAIERGKDRIIEETPEGTEYLSDYLESEALDEAKELADSHGEAAADVFHRIITATTPPVAEHYERWLQQQTGDITAQTAAQHRMAVRHFLEWAGEEISIGDVDRRRAGEYVDTLLQSGLSRKTVARRVSSLASLWQWLGARGLADSFSNPWRQQGLGKRGKRGQSQPRRQWQDAELVKLLTGEMTPQYTATLHDLARLALVTGARLDELCSLRTTDVTKRPDGWWLSIREGKTKAAVRDIPLHDSAAHVVQRRRTSSDGFLFAGLVPGGADKKRSWNVSKAFGRYCTKLGLTDEGLVFHSLRKTFTEAMEAAEVPQSTTQLLVGHTRTSLTYGRYSKGERVAVRDAIRRLKYSRPVMTAIRRAEPSAR